MVKADDIITDIIKWIDQNLHTRLKITNVAARAGYSRWHLQRVFFRVMNVTLAEYIRERKLELAAKSLIETNESIIEITCRFGFESQQMFTRVFTKKYKTSPARYRNMSKHR